MSALLAYLTAHWFEIAGVITGVASVALAVRGSVWNWPIGIANNIIYVIVFFQSRLFADSALQFAFIGVSLYGIYRWLRGGPNATPAPVRRAPLVESLVALAIGAAMTVALHPHLVALNDIAPWLDAGTFSFSLVAQYGLARKYWENWHLWIAINLVSIALYATKNLLPTAGLYAVYLALAVAAVILWRRDIVPRSRPAA